MSGSRITRRNRKNQPLTTGDEIVLNMGISLLCVSTTGREAGSSESASAFLKQQGKGTPLVA